MQQIHASVREIAGKGLNDPESAPNIEHVFEGLLLRHVTDVQKVLRWQLQRLVPGDVPLGEAADMWAAFDAIERHAAAAKTLLAARVDESRAWARAGDRSAEEHLARKAGTSRGAARRGLACSKGLRRLPATEAALRRGELSQAQAETIADAAAVNPGAEQALLDTARTGNLVRLREHANRAKAAGDPDPEATHRRLHAQRRLRRFTDNDSHHPPRPRPHRRPTHRPAVGHTGVHQHAMRPHPGHPARPPHPLDPGARDRARQPRPALHTLPPPQDPPQLGPRHRNRPPTPRPPRRPPPPRQPRLTRGSVDRTGSGPMRHGSRDRRRRAVGRVVPGVGVSCGRPGNGGGSRRPRG